MSRRVGMILLVAVAIALGGWVIERQTRAWRLPSYHVSLPAEFDLDDAEAHGKGGEMIHYSPRKEYLHWHRRGWDDAGTEWLSCGRLKHNVLVAVAGPANRALRDGRNQFDYDVGLVAK